MEFVQYSFLSLRLMMGFLCTSGLAKPIIVPKSFRCCHGRAYGPPSSANLIPQPWHPLFAPNFKLLTCASTLLAAHQNNSGTEVFGHIESVKILVILNPNDYMLTDIFRFCFLHLRYILQIPRNWSVNFLNYDQGEPAVSYRYTG